MRETTKCRIHEAVFVTSGLHPAILAAENLSLVRAGRTVARGVSLRLEPGKATLLRGPNGAGKTTLMRTLAGLLAPGAGTLRVETPDGARGDPGDLRAAAVFFGHLNALKSALTVWENLRFWTRLYGVRAEEEIGPALDAMELGPLARRRAGDLSAGQKRRAAFCRVLLSRKAIWLLDEPTASMDARAADLFRAGVESHCARGGSALIATHDSIAIEGAAAVELVAAA